MQPGAGDEIIDWFFETNELTDDTLSRKQLTALSMRLSAAPGTELHIGVRTDTDAENTECAHILCTGKHGYCGKIFHIGSGMETVTIPLRCPPCDHYSIHIRGRGDAVLYEMSRTAHKES